MATMSLMNGGNESKDALVGEDDTQPSPVESSTTTPHEPKSQPSHQRLVFADPAAFRYVGSIRLEFIAHKR